VLPGVRVFLLDTCREPSLEKLLLFLGSVQTGTWILRIHSRRPDVQGLSSLNYTELSACIWVLVRHNLNLNDLFTIYILTGFSHNILSLIIIIIIIISVHIKPWRGSTEFYNVNASRVPTVHHLTYIRWSRAETNLYREVLSTWRRLQSAIVTFSLIRDTRIGVCNL
jgi:hypothetical protein